MNRRDWSGVVILLVIIAVLVGLVLADRAEAGAVRLSRHPRTFDVGVTDSTSTTVGDTVYTVPADVAMLIGGSTPPPFFLNVTTSGLYRVPNLGSVVFVASTDGSTAQYISDQDGNITRRWVNITGSGYIIGY